VPSHFNPQHPVRVKPGSQPVTTFCRPDPGFTLFEMALEAVEEAVYNSFTPGHHRSF